MRSAAIALIMAGLALAVPSVPAQEKDADVSRLQGKWEVVELVEDGKVIPKDAIQEWLPSGGKFEISENAIIIHSPGDGKRHVKLFAIDATQSPKGLDIVTKEGKDAIGIFRFDDKRVILCLADADDPRPTDFSAKEGSKRVLMTLQRPAAAAATPPAEPAPKKPPQGIAGVVLTDAEVQSLLKGTWRYLDNAGALYAIFSGDGTFRTVREVPQLRVFQKAFVQTPISAGTWKVHNGQLLLHITSSLHADRVNQTFPFAIRSISDKDFIFVDYMGRVGQAARVR